MAEMRKVMNIKAERVRLGLSTGDAARALGVALNTLLGWERNEKIPNGSSLARLARFYGCSADWLLGITEERLPR